MRYLPKSRLAKSIAALLLGICLLLWLVWKPWSVHHHRSEMERAYDMMLVEYDASGAMIQKGYSAWENLLADFSGRSTEPWERYEYHRDELVELRFFEHRIFQFKHINHSTPASKKLWEILCAKEDLGNIHTSATESGAKFAIEAWDTPDKMPRWEQFVQEHDVPDFMLRFGE